MITLDPEDLNTKNHPLTIELLCNAQELCSFLKILFLDYPGELTFTRGYSTGEEQLRINPKNPDSAHTKFSAADVLDIDGAIYRWCLSRLELFVEHGCALESRTFAQKHTHIQMYLPKSGKTIFIP